MKKTITTLFIATVLLTSCNNGGSSSSTYEEKKMSLEDQEKQNPTDFLSAGGTYQPTLFGNNMKISGTVTNRATIATYKDVTIKVRYISNTDSDIGSGDYTIYDFFPPNQTKEFKIKIEVPDGTEKFGWYVVSAVPK